MKRILTQSFFLFISLLIIFSMTSVKAIAQTNSHYYGASVDDHNNQNLYKLKVMLPIQSTAHFAGGFLIGREINASTITYEVILKKQVICSSATLPYNGSGTYDAKTNCLHNVGILTVDDSNHCTIKPISECIER